MPVYDYTYKTWEGTRRSGWTRWMAIPKFTWMDMFSKKMFIWLFTMAWIQFLLRVVYIYATANTEFLAALNIPVQNIPAIGGFFFKNQIDVQMFFCFLFTFAMGSGLIAHDLRHNAIVLFMSKPINRMEYFAGKFLSLFLILMVLTGVQGLILFGLQTAVAGEETAWSLYFWKEYAWIAGATMIYSTLVSGTLTIMILAASSVTGNSRYAGTAFAMYIIGSMIIAGLLKEFNLGDGAWGVSIFHVGLEIGRRLFLSSGDMGSQIMEAWAAWLGLLGVWALSIAILKTRLTNAARYGRG